MKTILITLASFAFAGAIISPFFWLRFLKEKSVVRYLVASSITTVIFLFIYVCFLYQLIKNLMAKINADAYYFFYDSLDYASYIVIFLVVISPFIFTKIAKNKFTVKTFLVALILSAALFVSLFAFWAFVLLPQAFNQLHTYL